MALVTCSTIVALTHRGSAQVCAMRVAQTRRLQRRRSQAKRRGKSTWKCTTVRSVGSAYAKRLAQSMVARKSPEAKQARGLEAEREGFSQCDRQKLLKMLDLRIKSLSDGELERLQALLIAHDFLPS